MSLKSSFSSKLEAINETQESITSLSKFMLANVLASEELVDIWKSQLTRTSSDSKKLLLIYLCNDVVQQAKRLNRVQYIQSFSKILPNVVSPVYAQVDPKIKAKIDRVVSVWEQRQVFSTNYLDDLRKAFKSAKPLAASVSTSGTTAASTSTSTSSNQPIVNLELKVINDLLQHVEQLTNISQGNLTQLGIQSKTYLNLNADNLPKTQIHLNKLNVLEKLSKVSIKNIEEIKLTRESIISNIESLASVITEGIRADETKIAVIKDKMEKIKEVRAKLKSEAGEQEEKFKGGDVAANDKGSGKDANADDNNNNNNNNNSNSEDEDELPKYEDEEDSENEPELKKRKTSPSPSGGSTPRKVAFAEDIEVNEFEQQDSEEEEEQEEEEEEEEKTLEDIDNYNENGNDNNTSTSLSTEETSSEVMDLLLHLT